MAKDSKGKGKASKSSKKSSKRDSVLPSPQSLRNVNFEGKERVSYKSVALSDFEDPTEESDSSVGGGFGARSSKSKSKSKSKQKEKKVKKKKSKRRARDDSDDDDISLERKPSPVLAPIPSLTKEEYEFFEMVSGGDTDEVAAFLQSDSFKDMDINKLNKTGFSILHVAVKHQDEDMIRLLLEQPGIRLFDTLLYAIKEENVDVVKLLLKHYDLVATQEQRQTIMESALTITKDPTQQEQLSQMVSSSLAVVAPKISPLSARSGVKSSIRLNNSSRTVGGKKSKVKTYKSRSFYEKKTDIPVTTIFKEKPGEGDDDNDESPFDSEFSPVVTPLMLAAQQGNYELIELFYSRNERLETEEFHHDLNCSCDICAKLEGEQDMTRAYQRYHLYKALTNPNYMCFLGRMEHKDPVNYALKKIAKIRDLFLVDHAFKALYFGFESELTEFITKMLELCRNTTEAEIFMSPKDDDERLPHLYPRVWYTVGLRLHKFVAAPNTQSIVYKMWADDWPEWDSIKWFNISFWKAVFLVIFWPFIGLFLWGYNGCEYGRSLTAPVSRFLTYLGSYACFMAVVIFQACSPYQRCNDEGPRWQIDDAHCKQRGPPNVGTEPVLLLYILAFYVNMMKRQSVSWFWRMRWNWIELIDQLLFTGVFGCWVFAYLWTLKPENKDILKATVRTMWPQDSAEVIGDCLMSLAVLFAFGRMLRYIIVFPQFGKIQIGIGYQVLDFLKGLLIMSVVIIAFGSGLMGLYMPYSDLVPGFDPDDLDRKRKTQEDSFQSIGNTFQTLFWILQGKKAKETVKLLTWEVKNNKTKEMEDNHHDFNEYTGKGLFLGYHLIASLMLSNMLAGYFSQTMTQIEDNLDMYWKYARTELYLTFVKDTVLPPPLNLIPPFKALRKCCKWLTLLGRKADPKASCSLRQCCFITESDKTIKWKVLMKGYRKLILQLIFRYMNSDVEEKGEEPATKDDVLEIAEELAEIQAMLKKGSDKIESSSEDDDDDHQFPGGGSGALGSTKTGWKKTKTILQSSGATYLKNTVRSGGASGAPSGGASGAPIGGASGAPSGGASGAPSGTPSRNTSGGSGGNRTPAGGNSQMNANSPPSVGQQTPKSKSKSGNSSGGKSTPTKASQQTMNSPTNTTPKRDQSGGDNNFGRTPSIKSIKTVNMNKTPSSDVTGTPSGSYIISSVPTGASIYSQVTPEKPVGGVGVESGSMKTILDNKSPAGPLSSPGSNNKSVLNSSEYSTPKRGSRSGGGMERSPGMGDFSGPGEIDNIYETPSKSTNNFFSIADLGTPSKKSPLPQNSSKTTPTSNANNFYTAANTKDPSFKSMQSFKNNTNGKPSGIVTPGKPPLNNNNYGQTKSDSKSGGLERTPEMGDFSDLQNNIYKTPTKSTTKFYSIPEVRATPKKSPIFQDSTIITPTSKTNNLVDVYPSNITVANSMRGIPENLRSPAGQAKFEDSPPRIPMPTTPEQNYNLKRKEPVETFTVMMKPQNDKNQNSAFKSPSSVPSPAAKAKTTPPSAYYFSSVSSGEATDGSSNANDYKNPQFKSKSKPRTNKK